MANCKMLRFESLQEAGRFVFADAASDAVAADLAAYFGGRGYKLEGGSPTAGRYGVGSNLMRVLFGVFAKRFVFDFNIVPDGNGAKLTVGKGISGAMGGVIGYRRMNKELERILGDLRDHFA